MPCAATTLIIPPVHERLTSRGVQHHRRSRSQLPSYASAVLLFFNPTDGEPEHRSCFHSGQPSANARWIKGSSGEDGRQPNGGFCASKAAHTRCASARRCGDCVSSSSAPSNPTNPPAV